MKLNVDPKTYYPYIFTTLIITGVVFRPITIVTFILMMLYVLHEHEEKYIIGMLFFCMPFASAFKVAANTTSLFTYIQIFAVVVTIIRMSLKKKFFIAYFFYFVYIFVGARDSFIELIKQASYPLLLYICMRPDSLDSTEENVMWYCKGVIIASIVGVVKDYIPNLNVLVNEKVTRMAYEVYVNRFSGLFGDPNYYTVNLMLTFSVMLVLYIKGKVKEVVAFFTFLIIIVFGAMTGSKSFLLMLGVVIIIAFAEFIRNKKYITCVVLSVGMLIVISFVVNGKITTFNTILARITDAKSISELTTERTDLWYMYFENLFNHPLKLLVGNGLGKLYSFNRYPHNTYLDFLDILGVFGTVLFFYTHRCACFVYVRSRKLIDYIPFFVVAIMYFTLSMILHYNMIYHIILTTMIVYYDNYKKVIREK